MRWTPNYHTACRIQDRILNMMGVRTQIEEHENKGQEVADLKPAQLAALANAWNTLEERKRIIRMKPAPKAMAVESKRKAGPIRMAPME